MSVTDQPAPPGGPVRRRHTSRNAAIVVGVVMVGLILLLATRGTSKEISSTKVGQAAPEFTGETLDGGTFQLSRYRGEWVLVNFFATWCGPCRVEHPELVKFAQEHAGDPVQVVSVAYSDQSDAIRQFFAEQGGDWPVIPSSTGRISLDYGVTEVPETYVIAPSGLVVARVEGVTQAELNQIIEQAGGMAAAGGA